MGARRHTTARSHAAGGRSQDQVYLEDLAWRSMREKYLAPDFPPEALQQAEALHGPAEEDSSSIRDLRSLMWVSIDNDDSRDLDQITVAEDLGDGNVHVFVAIADVDALVKK